MRTLVLALMMALLPLRGWVADVMAVELAQPSQGAPHHAMAADPAPLHDCHQDHAGPAPMTEQQAHAQPADEHAAGDCGSCTVCQICHSVAMAVMLPPLPAAALPTAAPHSSQPRYVSAERAPDDKPPIA